MSPNASHRVRPGLSSAASLITTLLISFDQEVLNQHLNLDLNLVTPEYPFFESPWLLTARCPSGWMVWTLFDEGDPMSELVGIAGERIRSFVERIEQLDTELQELNEQKK